MNAHLIRTARLTGLAYLGLAVFGMLGHLGVRQRLYVPDDATATAANLVDHQTLAHVGTVADLTVVVCQALAAIGFLALYRRTHAVAAAAVAAFGLVNAVLILVATVCTTAALHVALAEPGTYAQPEQTVLLLHDLAERAWGLGGLFFGLWLVPMGLLVLRSGRQPRPLGWVLVAGGVGYVVSTYVTAVAPDRTLVATALTALATVGEVWMVGYLVWRGVRTGARTTSAATPG